MSGPKGCRTTVDSQWNNNKEIHSRLPPIFIPNKVYSKETPPPHDEANLLALASNTSKIRIQQTLNNNQIPIIKISRAAVSCSAGSFSKTYNPPNAIGWKLLTIPNHTNSRYNHYHIPVKLSFPRAVSSDFPLRNFADPWIRWCTGKSSQGYAFKHYCMYSFCVFCYHEFREAFHSLISIRCWYSIDAGR